MSKRRVPQPFGVKDDSEYRVQFDGTPDELNSALGNWLVAPVPVRKRIRRKDGTEVTVLIPANRAREHDEISAESTGKKRKTSKTVKTEVKPVVASTERRPLPASPPKEWKPGRKIDRNRDGASKEELYRAKHLVNHVFKVDPEVRAKYIDRLDQLTREMTNFLVTEIAPFESALEAALDDAEESIMLMTGAQNAAFSLGRAERIIHKLPELKTIDFMCQRLNLPEDIRLTMIAEYVGGNNDPGKLSYLQKLQQVQRQAQGLQRPVREARQRKQDHRSARLEAADGAAQHRSNLGARTRSSGRRSA